MCQSVHKTQARKDDKAFGKWVVCKQALISSAARPAFLWPQEDLRCVWEMFAGVLASKISAGSLVGLLLDCIAEGLILSLPAKKHSCKSTYHEGLLERQVNGVVWCCMIIAGLKENQSFKLRGDLHVSMIWIM